MLPFYVEAEYESGYKHTEDEQDMSPYVKDGNIFSDIVNGRPSEAHGALIRWTLYYPGLKKHWTIDWTQLPENSVPIYAKHMHKQLVMGVDDEILSEGEEACSKIEFGYKYIELETGEIKGHILEVVPED